MPLFVAALLGGLVNIAGTLAGRVMIALGFGAVTYTGLSTSLAWLKTQAVSSFAGMGTEVVQLLAALKVGESISIVTSAILVKQLLNGLSSDAVKRFILK